MLRNHSSNVRETRCSPCTRMPDTSCLGREAISDLTASLFFLADDVLPGTKPFCDLAFHISFRPPAVSFFLVTLPSISVPFPVPHLLSWGRRLGLAGFEIICGHSKPGRLHNSFLIHHSCKPNTRPFAAHELMQFWVSGPVLKEIRAK